MNKENKLIEKLHKSFTLKNLSLKSSTIDTVIKEYNKAFMNILLEDGCIDINNGLHLEVVQLEKRIHVLRGIAYEGTRDYKLKATMSNEFYKKLDEYYSDLKKGLLDD